MGRLDTRCFIIVVLFLQVYSVWRILLHIADVVFIVLFVWVLRTHQELSELQMGGGGKSWWKGHWKGCLDEQKTSVNRTATSQDDCIFSYYYGEIINLSIQVILTYVVIWPVIQFLRIETSNCGNSLLDARMTSVSNPGLKLRLSQEGLNYAASVAVDVLAKQIILLEIQDLHDIAYVRVGTVQYNIYNIKATHFVKPRTDVIIVPGDMKWMVYNAGLSIHGHWNYNYTVGPLVIQDEGTFDAETTGISVTISIDLGVGETGHPTISTRSCTSVIKNLSIRLNGGESWVYEMFVGFVEGPLRRSLANLIRESAQKIIDENASTELQNNLEVDVTIKNDWLFDYRLMVKPMFASGYLESFHRGRFFIKSDPHEPPFFPSLISTSPSTESMVTIWISEYVLNAVGYAMFKHGNLVYYFTKKDLSESTAKYLDTSCKGLCIGKLLPLIGIKYPNATVELEFVLTEPPKVEICVKNVYANFVAHVMYHARAADESLTYLFATKLSVRLTLDVYIEETTIKATVNDFKPVTKVMHSAVGPVSSTVLQWTFDVGKYFVKEKLTEICSVGFLLPSLQNVQFVNSRISLEKRQVCLKTDAKYVESADLDIEPTTLLPSNQGQATDAAGQLMNPDAVNGRKDQRGEANRSDGIHIRDLQKSTTARGGGRFSVSLKRGSTPQVAVPTPTGLRDQGLPTGPRDQGVPTGPMNYELEQGNVGTSVDPVLYNTDDLFPLPEGVRESPHVSPMSSSRDEKDTPRHSWLGRRLS